MRQSSAPPPWFIFLSSIALVLGLYYLWLGGRDYIRTGGLGIEEATQQAVIVSTATAVRRATDAIPTDTPIPTFTPVPPCQEWIVSVGAANVRLLPDTTSPVVEVFSGGDDICVIEQVPDTVWYKVDTRPETRRVDEGYMRGDVIRPQNPTATPTDTVTPLPTVTPLTPTLTITPSVTPTVDPDAPTATNTRTPRPSRTPVPPSTTPTVPPPIRSA